MTSLRFFILSALLLITSFVKAQNTKEFVQNRNQIKVDRHLLERDTKELEVFKANSIALKAAFANKNLIEARRLKNILTVSMQREVSQTEAKVARAKAEVVQSSQEVKSDRREKRRNRRQYTGSTDDKQDIVRDRANTRDDKRDRRDDVRDLEELQMRASNQARLLNSFKAIKFSSVGVYAKQDINASIIQKFIASMLADIDETKEELREDKRESREDRRERRDDRNERREKY